MLPNQDEDKNDEMTTLEKFNWDAPEYVRNERTADWYWSISLLIIASVFACIYFKNYLLGGVVLLSGILVIAYAVRDVVTFAVSIDSSGIRAGGRFFKFDAIHAFSVMHHKREGYKLLLKVETLTSNLIVIPITANIDPADLERFLSERLAVEDLQEPPLQQLFELIF